MRRGVDRHGRFVFTRYNFNRQTTDRAMSEREPNGLDSFKKKGPGSDGASDLFSGQLTPWGKLCHSVCRARPAGSC